MAWIVFYEVATHETAAIMRPAAHSIGNEQVFRQANTISFCSNSSQWLDGDETMPIWPLRGNQPSFEPPPCQLPIRDITAVTWIATFDDLGVAPGRAASFKVTESFLVVADAFGEGFDAEAEVRDVGVEPGEGEVGARISAVRVDQGDEFGVAVEGGARRLKTPTKPWSRSTWPSTGTPRRRRCS